MNYEKKFLEQAIKISKENIKNGGGPFGAVITLNAEVIAESGNSVTIDCDPTAHAEVNAIRKAGKKLQTHDLSECTLYASCEPCPMCLSAIYWSGIKTVYFANNKNDAEKAGFRDAFIYKQFCLPNEQKSISLVHKPILYSDSAFKQWAESEDVTKY